MTLALIYAMVTTHLLYPRSSQMNWKEGNQMAPRRSQTASRRHAEKSEPTVLGRLRRYRVNGLFDTFKYDFELDAGGPTLLTGVNGTGKSTILRTIDAVSAGRWEVFTEIPFHSMYLDFESGKQISVVRETGNSVRISLSGEKEWSYRKSDGWDQLFALERELDYLAARAGDEPYSREREAILHHRVALLRELELQRRHSRRSGPDVPEWVQRLSELFPVLFITDQRLIIENPRHLGERERSTRAAADEVARQIATEMKTAKSNYGNRSQALDHDFPQRVIRAIENQSTITDQELRSQLEELTRKSEALESVGLLAKESVSEFADLDLALANVMPLIQTYVDDSRRKLEVLENLRVKLQLFSDFLRQHYGRKRIVLDPEEGLTVLTSTGSPVPPNKLSSGEQQMMVLAHQILFKANQGTLVLIDEPELSLHVIWQSTFVDDLAEMGKVNALSFLLATHSPTLIGAREDLKRSLDRMSEK